MKLAVKYNVLFPFTHNLTSFPKMFLLITVTSVIYSKYTSHIHQQLCSLMSVIISHNCFPPNIDQIFVIILFFESYLWETGLGRYSFIFVFTSNLLSVFTCNVSGSVVFLILLNCFNLHQASIISVLKSPFRNYILNNICCSFLYF